MKKFLPAICLFFFHNVFAQEKTAKDFGFRQLNFPYQNDTVQVLIQSKEGEENRPKPLFFFCQGSLPIPLIIYNDKDVYGTFPFIADSLTQKYHLVIVSKPGVPLMKDAADLQPDLTYRESNGDFPKKYTEKNFLSYYVPRNLAVIRYLQKQPWVNPKRLVVAGHSEGSTIAVKMAAVDKRITHLIYSGGNPMGRIVSILQQSRARETEQSPQAENDLKYYARVVAEKEDLSSLQGGESNKTLYEFSEPVFPYLEKLRIPVLITYGTLDWNRPYVDYLRADFIRKNKTNTQFKAYIGTEHNYFPMNENHEIDYGQFNWDKVAGEWLDWLNTK